ncbi:NCS1 family nucleobase:cation symporter-1 [Asaia krungthepensis]|uniref:APC transporter NCS1 n=1 Tax=Asaia krungthepensis NRIC 0535 TaxID=1307925 RepID=A0ABQ0Q3E5_9PROT|nr:NCS1 family nucleobase:cation symporter-1 [Asaia krungthepensis]GBQ89385.1 APC transporter NCS1 [Asaia krungthepensis NRIC 0535]
MNQGQVTGLTGPLTNVDLAPVRERHWAWKDFLFLWMSNVHSVAGYMTLGSFFMMGLPVGAVLAGLLIAILCVHLLCNLVAVPSLKAGVPFPVVIRGAFGVYGAIIPALVRGVIAVGWYGIQTWLASNAIVLFILHLDPAIMDYADLHRHGALGLSMLGWGAFLFVWALQMVVFWRGMEAIRHFIDWAGPAIYGVILLLDGALLIKTQGQVHLSVLPRAAFSWRETLAGLLAVASLTLAYFSPIILNFGDFARYGLSLADVKRGNLWGLPVNFMAFVVLVLTTLVLTQPALGRLILDPAETIIRFDNQTIMLVGTITLVAATIGINISANFVSAAFDFSNIAPSAISWRQGGVIASFGAVLLTPWNLYAHPELIHLTLDILGLFIAPVTGILLVDYYGVQKQTLDLPSLYNPRADGRYWYRSGVNPRAVLALALAVALGLLVVFLPALHGVQNFSWVIGFVTGGVFHALLSALRPAAEKAA